MSKNDYDEKCRLLIIGDAFVGKTSFLSMYANGIFNLAYLATTSLEFFRKDDEINNKIVRIELWDSAGTEKFHSLTSGFFRNAQGIMVMFDVTNPTSFENIRNWTESIKMHLSSELNSIPVIIIGNKIDLLEREIKTDEAKKYCKELGFKYFETSAKTGENVNGTIKYLVKEVLKIRDENNRKVEKTMYNNNQEKGNNKKYKRQNEGNCECKIV